MPSLLHLCFLLLAAVCVAQNLAGPQYITCACSPSNRGYRVSVLEELQQAVLDLRDEVANWNSERRSEAEIDRLTYEKAIDLWNNCVGSHSAEECVNADAALRVGACGGSECASMCKYDRGTWKNFAAGMLNPACDAISRFRTTDQELLNGPAAGNDVRPSAVNRNPGPPAENIPQTSPPPSVTSGNNGGSGTNSSGVPITEMPISGDVKEPPPTRREGCVAVEHLKGYVLQHRPHLMRPVLCGRGFCATPNHAIIVRGEMTSMKMLCEGKWECVRSVKLVNNLKLAVNRRAVVNEFITVTPYDIRFPKWAIWAVQMLEDVRNLVAVSVALGGVATIGVLVAGKLSRDQ